MSSLLGAFSPAKDLSTCINTCVYSHSVWWGKVKEMNTASGEKGKFSGLALTASSYCFSYHHDWFSKTTSKIFSICNHPLLITEASNKLCK